MKAKVLLIVGVCLVFGLGIATGYTGPKVSHPKEKSVKEMAMHVQAEVAKKIAG